QALDVEDDVGHVLDDAGDGRDLVLHALDLDLRNRAAFEAREQDAPQAVADGHAEAALERLDVELTVGVGERAAVGVDLARQLQPAPANSHEKPSTAVGFPPPSPRPGEGGEPDGDP